jgi:hypothetical protein
VKVEISEERIEERCRWGFCLPPYILLRVEPSGRIEIRRKKLVRPLAAVVGHVTTQITILFFGACKHDLLHVPAKHIAPSSRQCRKQEKGQGQTRKLQCLQPLPPTPSPMSITMTQKSDLQNWPSRRNNSLTRDTKPIQRLPRQRPMIH